MKTRLEQLKDRLHAEEEVLNEMLGHAALFKEEEVEEVNNGIIDIKELIAEVEKTERLEKELADERARVQRLSDAIEKIWNYRFVEFLQEHFDDDDSKWTHCVSTALANCFVPIYDDLKPTETSEI